MKQCTRCHKAKALTEFNKDCTKADGHNHWCRECTKKKDGARKLLVLKHYGGEIPTCACCHETAIEFLAIDHADGNGNQHRKAIGIGSGDHFYRWLIKQGFPPGYRVLCFNCNHAYGHYGYCPHQLKQP